jgi:hypothetical protein
MAAAPGLVVGESPVASPELALVDPELAKELRRSLSHVADTWLRPRANVEEAFDAMDEDPPLPVSPDEPGNPESRDAEHLHHDECVVDGIVELPSAQSQQTDGEQGADDEYMADVIAPEHLALDEYIVDTVEPTAARNQRTSSNYPDLPAPGPEERGFEETEAALRGIRERMTEELPAAPKRKLRRRFTFASGVGALCAVGVLAVDIQFEVAQLPGWLLF